MLANLWRSLSYPVQGAILRFVRIVAAAMLVALGTVLIHIASPEQALNAFEFAVGTALLAAADKLNRELANVRSAKSRLLSTAAVTPQTPLRE